MLQHMLVPLFTKISTTTSAAASNYFIKFLVSEGLGTLSFTYHGDHSI